MFEIHNYIKNISYVDAWASIIDPGLINTYIKRCNDFWSFFLSTSLGHNYLHNLYLCSSVIEESQ